MNASSSTHVFIDHYTTTLPRYEYLRVHANKQADAVALTKTKKLLSRYKEDNIARCYVGRYVYYMQVGTYLPRTEMSRIAMFTNNKTSSFYKSLVSSSVMIMSSSTLQVGIPMEFNKYLP